MDQAKEQALGALLEALAATGYAFVPPTPETHRRVNARPGNEIAADLRGVFGWSRAFAADLVGQRLFGLMGDAGILEPAGSGWRSRVRVAALNGALYLHSAFPTVEPDAVFFGPDTYRFVRAAIGVLPHRRYGRAADIGCGSGAGLLAISAARDIGALVMSDINPAAVALARVNAAHQRRPALIVESDLFAALDGDFDLIVANPPYMADAGKRAYRDGGGDIGIELAARIVGEALARLAPGGALFVYSGAPVVDGVDRLRARVEQIHQRECFDLDYQEIDPDVFGEELDAPAYREVERIAVIGLTIRRKR